MNISTSTIQQRRRKPAQTLVDEEDAAQLKLGAEFDLHQISHSGDVAQLLTLNLSETRLLIRTTLRQRRQNGPSAEALDGLDGDDDDEEDFTDSNEVQRKTREYLSIFARFRTEQTVSAVDRLLRSDDNAGLHPFEIAQLGSLACEEAEEVKTLIPSLADKKSDQELQGLLDQLRQFS